jgi:hypothetical protein
MGGVSAGGRVQFDFEGSLALARRLWALADDLEAAERHRESDFDVAMASWRGEHAQRFRGRRETERLSKRNVVAGLRDDAQGWARAWASALDQQNRNNWAAQVERVRDDRNLLEKGWDATFGKDDSDESVPKPAPVRVPTAPDFRPTATEVRF